MATKLELESERNKYQSLIHQANQALAANDRRLAIQHALASLAHLEDAMQFEKRYEKNEQFRFSAHDIVFQNCVPLFAFKALDAIETQLDESKKLEKNAFYDFRGCLAEARGRMSLAAKLWDAIGRGEATPSAIAEA